MQAIVPRAESKIGGTETCPAMDLGGELRERTALVEVPVRSSLPAAADDVTMPGAAPDMAQMWPQKAWVWIDGGYE